MRHILLGILAVAAANMTFVAAQPSGGGPVVERLDPALDEILSVDATLDVIKQDYFGANEGPTWVPETGGGYLAFSDMAANRIYKWDPVARQLSVLVAGAGYTGNDLLRVRAFDNGRLIVALLGTNGLDIDLDGRLVFCAHGDRALGRIEVDGTRTILADRFEGKRFNGPNDLVVKSDGSIYFTDPGAPLVGGFANSPDRELDFRGGVSVDARRRGPADFPGRGQRHRLLTGRGASVCDRRRGHAVRCDAGWLSHEWPGARAERCGRLAGRRARLSVRGGWAERRLDRESGRRRAWRHPKRRTW